MDGEISPKVFFLSLHVSGWGNGSDEQWLQDALCTYCQIGKIVVAHSQPGTLNIAKWM